MENNKLLGILYVFIGIILGIFTISLRGKGELIIPGNTDLFIVKYFVPILLINGCFIFIIMGLLQLFGFIVPYYSVNSSELNKSKINVVMTILSLPLWISMTATIFYKSTSITWKTIFICLLLYFTFSFWKGIKELREKPGCEMKGRKR